MINQRGFSLLELMIVIGIGTMIAFMKFQDMKNEQESVMSNAVGQQIKQLGEAVNSYISVHYDKLSTLSSSNHQSSDPGPRTCSGSICEITYLTLINEGLLPSTYSGMNIQKSSYKILLKRSGTSPNYVINGLVTTTVPWKEANNIRFDLLGKAMQSAGVDSGMTQSATSVSGYNGLWSEKSTDFPSITSSGLLAYRAGYNSAMYSVYLRRDGTLPMTGDLNMGGNDISNAKDIRATGLISGYNLTILNQSIFNAVDVKGNTNMNGDLHIGGGIRVDGNAIMNRGVEVTDDISVGKNIISSGNIITRKDIYAQGDIQSYKNIMASGNISAVGLIAGKYLKAISTDAVGLACTEQGIISKNEQGKLLSCQSGKWVEVGGQSGSIIRTGTNNLTLIATGDFDYMNISILSKFTHADRSHTGNATFNVLLNGQVVGQITTSIEVRKGGSQGHYWGYENTGGSLKMYNIHIGYLDKVEVVFFSGNYHVSSDISVSLSK